MTATARPPVPGPRRGAGVAAGADPRRPLLPPTAARLIALAALAGYAALRWATLLAPAASGRMAALAALALAAGVATGQLARLPWSTQAPAAIAVVGAWAALSALVAGASAGLVLDPGRWDELAAGIGVGLDALPSMVVPYDEPASWPRTTVLLGGALLLVLGCVLALPAGRRAPFGGGAGLRFAAAAPLVAAAVVPTAITRPDGALLEGVAVFALLAGFLWLERLPRAAAPGAVALLAAAGAAGALAQPALDRDEPWLDAQELVARLDRSAAVAFDWTQRYGPLDWPRVGREVLRVRAPRPSYWKAQHLDAFDGVRWRQAEGAAAGGPLEETPPEAILRDEWRMALQVTVGALTTADAIGAGITLAVDGAPQELRPSGSPGTWRFAQPLAPGDRYAAVALVPRPGPRELRAAPAAYPDLLTRYTMVALPTRRDDGRWAAGEPAVVMPWFGDRASPWAQDAQRRVAASPYARTYALARRLADRSPTPYAFVQAVLGHLSRGYVYDERPPRRALPLPAFLFADRAGYCQQFAGAAALLLRMGGVPTRVVTGFTTGRRTADGTYVVRDHDAHAWIEVWFPRAGWVRFDPTPASAPARQHAGTAADPTAGAGRTAPRRRIGRPANRPPAAVAPGDGGDGGPPWAWVAVALAALLAAAAAGRRLLAMPATAAAATAELERALRWTGRAAGPATTLAQLERRLRDAPEAAAYVRAVRLARYGAAPLRLSARQRRRLRAALARGRGVGGRLRALAALPPRWPR